MPQNAGRTLLNKKQERKWKKRQAELGDRYKLAEIFRGWMPEGYFANGKPRILYVGKATSGDFGGVEPERKYFNGSRAFWRFARQIAAEVGCDDENLSCIAWSNISKISVRTQFKAEPSLIAGFEEIAAATLESEIKATKPHVIVFVTYHFNDQVAKQIAEGPEDSGWNRSENESNIKAVSDIWWRRRKDGAAVLWMRHPMTAGKKQLDFAARKIASLVTP